MLKVIMLAMSFLVSSSYSKCKFPKPVFIDQTEKKVQVAALGSFSKLNERLIFKPIVCMNIENCSEVDLTSFPKYERNSDMNPVLFGFKYGKVGVLQVISAKEKSFDDSILEQKKFVSADAQRMKLSSSRKTFDNFCGGNENSSILVFTDGTFRKGTFREKESSMISFEDKFKLTFSKKAELSMKGCGCEEYFGEERKSRSIYNSVMSGRYIKKGNKLYFIENLSDQLGNTPKEKEYEILEGDRCNYFVNDIIDKKVEIGLYESLNIKNNTISFINACKNPILRIE